MKRRGKPQPRPRSRRPKEAAQGPTKTVGGTTNSVGGSGWADLFASGTLARLLTVFLTRPGATFYQRELADLAGSRLYAVQRELARLQKAGLVARMPRGNRVYYAANHDHPAFDDLRRVVLKTLGLGDALRAALAPLADRVQLAFIYGSCARGDEKAGSDIDLLLVGELSLRDASAVLGPVARDLGRELNPTVYPREEFRTKAAQGHHFITEVLSGEKIYLIGDEDALEGLVGLAEDEPPGARAWGVKRCRRTTS